MLQLLVRPVRNRICYASIPDFTDNAYYLFAHAIKTRSGIEHVWLVHERSSVDRIEAEFSRLAAAYGQRGHRLRVLHWHSPSAYWHFLRSRCVAHTHGLYHFSRAAVARIRIGLWHGMPIKCIGRLNTITPNPKPPFATHYIATSYFFKYVLAQAFGAPAERVLVVGQPRNDALLFPDCRSRNNAEIRQRLGVEGDDRIVLWMPTYRAEGRDLEGARAGVLRSFLDDLDRPVLDRFIEHARQRNCVVLVKLHPFERSEAHASLPHGRNLRVFSDSQWRELDIQLYDVLGMADALISDVSSVMVDFTITGKPIGCFGFDARTYTRDLVFPLTYLIDAAGIHLVNDERSATGFFEAVLCGRQNAAHRTAEIFAHRQTAPASQSILDLCFGHADVHGDGHRGRQMGGPLTSNDPGPPDRAPPGDHSASG
ncbi:MAG: CDP-glycerol glycerophosphotransferase family protein [Gammaproteobacteria bacterium]|nr:CDP-glycerol glycerophosphotransferase family protein [Gammaproteobacteria bacterium]